jgi:hypothetical protein
VSLFGSQFITWRGMPLVPSDKVPVEDGKTKILLLRVGEKRQGVVGCSSPAWPASRARACRCASWASAATPSPPT